MHALVLLLLSDRIRRVGFFHPWPCEFAVSMATTGGREGTPWSDSYLIWRGPRVSLALLSELPGVCISTVEEQGNGLEGGARLQAGEKHLLPLSQAPQPQRRRPCVV